ncbi:hypothetical protein TRFO_30259 [Tritrichomonas foetus]|uniref:Uncharacterized protein n=1 Tax=Tritrichomonas foetus TaxID=1144522 RepID=A0A1J4JTT6_9EUKA|nr:hypothetical protein TRFO_30259 [Tritrichomonas foetus]|eukprot:OHT02537.1 hypothetical protein TRFO_30259 [Tritrichomonas foetus]
MGNQHSSNKGIASSNYSLCLRFGCLSDPSFYLEKNIIQFFFDNTKFISESPKHLHSVNDLMNLVFLCPEQITDLDSVLEEIILLDTPNKTDYIGLLELNFKKYIQMSIDRNMRYQLFCNHRDYSLVQNQHFEIIYSHIHDTFSALFQQKHSKDSILKVQNFLKSDPNIWSISPPVAAFFPTNGENTINCTKYLNGNYPRNIDYSTINLGNLGSNGQFLFWFLPPHPSNAVFVIFPIFNNGILMEPKNIEVLLDGVNSQSKMILNSQIVNIYGLSENENDAAHSRKYLLPIDKLIFCNDYYNGETKSLSVPSVPYRVSDAVFKVNIEKGKISVFDVKDDTTIYVVNTANNSTLGNEIPTALNNKKSNIIVETNGSVLNFIKPIEEGKYLCKSYSLITGKHLRNEEFESPETIISSTIDSINYCRWCLTKTKDNQYFMKKVALQGGMNFHIFGLRCSYKYSNEYETSKYRIFQKLYHHVLHYCASSIIPNYLICNSYQHFQSLIEFLETSFKFENPTIMNTLAIIISLNIPMFKNEMNHQEKILNLMNNLPCGLSFLLFFPNLTSFFSYNIDLALNTTITLISKADSKDNDYMLSYAFRQLEKYDFLAFIDFNQNNILSTIIPQDLQSTKDIKRSIISLLLIHQRVLIRNVTNFSKHDPYSTINFKVSVQEGGNPLNIIYDYASLIINHLSLAINKDLLTTKSENSKSSKQNKINSQNALPESLLYFLYTNFLNLLSDLSKYHVISQFMMSLLSVLLEQLLVTKVEDIEMQRVILSSIFSYGMFASTLIVGGNTTEFEERYSWLIRNNIHLLNTPIINYLESSSIEEFEDPTFNLFLNNELALDKIYQKYKPQFNRKLNESLKFIDKLSILAISKHIGCLEELFKLTDINFKGTIQLTTKFRKALDQMMKIRNTFHKLSQEHKPTHDINIKCLMLIRMTADSFNFSEISPEDIQKLVTGSLTPQKIVKILNMQKNRVEITSLGFSFLKVVLNSKVDNIFAKIISHTMGKIETFDGLASIMHILRPSSNQKDEINSFFELALNYPEMRIVAFRFFKSIKSLSEIKSNILANILKTSAMTQLPPSLFALAFSLIDSDTLFLDELVKIHPLASTRLSLLGAFAKYSIIPLEIQNDLLNVLWTVKQNEIRQILKILFFAIDQIDASILQNLFLEMLVYIGNQFSTNSDISIAIEIIMFLRKIIEYGTITVSGILSNLMTCYHEENFEEIPIIGIVSVLGLQVENFHFIATINDSLYDKTADQYLVMSNSSNQEIYYKKPFDLKTPPRLTKIPAEKCIVVPEITITKFIYTEYISRILRACLVYSRIPCTLPICAQTSSHFCRFENYTNFIKPDLVDLLGSLITPFENINNTIKEIKSLQSKKAIQDYSPIFGVLQSQGHYSYISPPISISAPDFKVTAKIPNENDFQGYFGIVSDTLEKRHTRYSIISFPKCVTFPQNQEIGQFNNCNNCITFNVLNNSKKIEVLGKLIEFPTGKQFKVIFMTQATMLDLNVNPLSSKTNNEIFDSSLPPTLIPTTTDKFDDDENDGLFNYPSFIKNFTGNQPLKPEIAQYSAIFNIAKPMSKAKKLRYYLIAPPDDQPISIGFADEASYSIIKHQIAGLYKKLANQWITLGLARITYQRPDLLINYAFELFRAFCIPLELFDQTEFNLNRFPFALFTPAWESKKVFYLSIENDLKKALVSLINDSECFSIITSRIFELNHDKKIHLCALPSSNSVTILNTENIIFAFPNSIIAFNDFNGYEKEICSLLRNSNESVNFPYIRGKDINSNAPNSPEILSFNKKYDERDFTILNIDSSSNNWVFNTSFELMILYKNLVLADKKKELNVKVKSFLLDIFLLQSPFILPYIHQFLYFVQNMVISTPFDNEIEYLRRLVALAGFVKASPDPDEVFISFYKHEQELFCDQFIARFSMHFPEFFNSKIPLPRINTVTIPEVIIHPAALSNRFDFYYHVQQIHKFMNLNKNDKLNQTIMTNNSFGNSSFKTNPLAGIPFWHIFPFWYRIKKLTMIQKQMKIICHQKPN